MCCWPAEIRWHLISAMQRLSNRLLTRVGADNYPDAFHASLAAMVGPHDLQTHGQSIHAAIEAAAAFCPQMSAAAAGMIHNRIKQLAGNPERSDRIEKHIRGLAGDGKDGCPKDAADPHALAEKYILGLRESTGLTDPEQPVLLYFRSEFYRWSSTIWERQEDDLFRANVTAFSQKSGVPKVSCGFVENVIAHLRGICVFGDWSDDMPFFIESLNPPRSNTKTFMVCENGILDLKAVIKKPSTSPLAHDSRFFTTLKVPWAYNSDAKCKKWKRFLNQVLPKQNDQDHRQAVLQEFFGYSLLADCRFEKALLLYGPARAGKSTIMRVWEMMLGAGSVSHIPLDQLGQEFRLIDLRGKAANFSSESDHMGRAKENLLKQVISGEPITANRKHRPTIELRSFAKLVIACNDLPTITDTSEGVWRRLIAMPFEDVVPPCRVDNQLAAKLAEELPGILNWALAGLRRLLEQGHFTHCERCEETLAEHRTMSDSVAEFLAECVTEDADSELYTQRLYEVYRYFCEARGRHGVRENEFGKRLLRNHNFGKSRATTSESRPYIYTGMSLTPQGREWANKYRHTGAPQWATLAVATR
jgi:P4 family phage/plasmid primase-like protien